ncbi:MAG: hypothetical protein EXR78_09995 [Deltaproteobacteria bacterium]|nr:hypothetical protein [Deltaproteobacteria bacterium]
MRDDSKEAAALDPNLVERGFNQPADTILDSRVEVEFSAARSARECLSALVALFYGAAETRTAVDSFGRRLEDLDCDDLQHGVLHGARIGAEFVLTLGGQPARLAVSMEASDRHVVVLRLPIQRQPAPATVLWVQSAPNGKATSRVLAMPVTASAFASGR